MASVTNSSPADAIAQHLGKSSLLVLQWIALLAVVAFAYLGATSDAKRKSHRAPSPSRRGLSPERDEPRPTTSTRSVSPVGARRSPRIAKRQKKVN